MFKILLFILLTLASFSQTLSVTNKTIETGKSITIQSKEHIFKTGTRYTHKALAECMPTMDVVYKVISSKKLEIIPKIPWESDTVYTCHLDTRFLNASPQEMYDFSFATPKFNLIDYHYFSDEKLLRLEFNDKVALKTLKAYVKLYKRQNLAKTALQYTVDTEDKRVILFKINEAVGESLSLKLLSGLRSASGKNLEREVVKEIDKENRGEVTLNQKRSAMVLSDAPRMIAKEDGSFAMRIFFNDSFYNKPVKKFIHVEGIEHFRLKKDVYIEREVREKYGITNSYYYVDVLSAEFKSNRDYTLTLYKGLSHYRELKEDKTFRLRTGDRRSTVLFNNSEPYVSNLGEIGFSSTNVERATVIVEQITPENYRYFVNYSEGAMKDATKFTRELFSKDVQLDNPKNETQKQKIALEDIATRAKHGVYKITIAYEEKSSEGKVFNRTASKVVFVSDIGMSVNLSEDQAFVSLLSLSSGKPIPHAEVKLYSVNNILIASATSDEAGIAIINKKALMEEEPKAVIVSTPEDKSFLLLKDPVNDVSYEALEKVQERYRAFVYFQSNIIRPAGRVRALIAVKDRDFISASKIPVKVTLSKLHENTLHKAVYTTDRFGLIDFSYALSNYDKTGAYVLKVRLGDKVIGKKIIDVEAFMPPKIENRITTDKEAYGSDAFIRAKVRSDYLFGAPASYLRGEVDYIATAFDYSHPKYRGYSFTDWTLEQDNEQRYIHLQQNISLDDKGEQTLLLPCSTRQRVPSILKATIGVTIMDDTQPVSTYKTVDIYPYRALVGVKVSQEIIESGQVLEGSTVLIDPLQGTPVDRALTVRIKKVNWHYNYSSGHYNWEKEMQVINTFTVPSNQPFSMEVGENGEFVVEVIDRLGGHSATSSFEVSGWGYSNISPKEDLKRVEIRFEEKLYKKGDILKASFNSPVLEGRMLVTLEGKKVHWHKSIEIEKGSAKLEIPLDVAMERGLYLHATAIRKTDREPTIIPFRAMGYAFVKPDRTLHNIKIDLAYQKVTPSKKTVPLHIKTDREAAVLVSVVDSGILNITEQKPPKMFDFFNPAPDKRLLYFDLYDRVMHYLTEGNLIAFGAGEMEAVEKRKKHLAPENLERIKPFMLWSKIIHTKGNEAEVALPIPEFNGKATIVAIAIDKSAVGVESGDIVIKDDIMVKPSYPRFLLEGDRIEVPVRLFNTTNTLQHVTLESNSTSNVNLRLDKTALQVAPQSSEVIVAKLDALKEGRSSIELRAEAGGEHFGKSVVLQVMSPYAMQTKSYVGATSKRERITLPKAYRGGKMLVSLSDNPIGQLRGDLKYLISYPYGCAEQTSSKIAAMFYSKPFMKNDTLLGEADNFIRQGIKKLSRMQNGHGEFSYWEQGGYVNPYASLYTAQTLLALDAAGYTLSGAVKGDTLRALRRIAKGKKLSIKYDIHHRLYAAYILSEHGALERSTANMLYENKTYTKYYFSRIYMAAIFKNMKEERLAEEIYKDLKMIRLYHIATLDYTKIHTRPFASKQRDMLLFLYLNAKHFVKRKTDFEEAKKLFTTLYSTHEKALAFRAMHTYLGTAVHEKMEVALKLNGTTREHSTSTAFTEEIKESRVVIAPLSGVTNYTIEAYKPLPRAVKNELSTQKALSIKRDFIDTEGNVVDLKQLEQGSRLYSRVTVANYPKLENIVLNQRIPACMEILNTRIEASAKSPFRDRNLLLDYKDIRDDRVLHFMHMNKKVKYETIPGTHKRKTIVLQNQTIIYTPLIATTVGECQLPAVTVEAMYDSRVNDYAKQTETVIVRPKGEVKKISKAKHPTHQEVKERVRAFYLLEAATADPKAFIPYFRFPLKHHFGEYDLSREKVLKNKANYNKLWKKRHYTIKSIEIIEEEIQLKRYRVKISFEYRLENNRGKSIQGISRHLVTLKYSNGKLLIEGIKALR